MTTRRQLLLARRAAMQEAGGDGSAAWEAGFDQYVQGFDRAIEAVTALLDGLPGSDARGFEALFAEAGYHEAKLHAELALEALRR